MTEEYERVREEIAEILNECVDDYYIETHPANTIIDQILAIEGICVKADDQGLPEIRIDTISKDIRVYIGKLYEYYQAGHLDTELYKELVKTSGIIQADIEHHMYQFAQEHMLKAGFVKVISNV